MTPAQREAIKRLERLPTIRHVCHTPETKKEIAGTESYRQVLRTMKKRRSDEKLHGS